MNVKEVSVFKWLFLSWGSRLFHGKCRFLEIKFYVALDSSSQKTGPAPGAQSIVRVLLHMT